MTNPRPVKIIRVGTSLAFIIPADICRDLSIHRGDYFDLRIGDIDTMIAGRLKVVASGQFEEARDNNLPVLKHE